VKVYCEHSKNGGGGGGNSVGRGGGGPSVSFVPCYRHVGQLMQEPGTVLVSTITEGFYYHLTMKEHQSHYSG
jgi:hypothetical protein